MPVAPKLASAVAYNFSGWDGYLLPAVLPCVINLPAIPGETSERVLERLPDGVNGLIFHIDLTVSRFAPIDRARLVEALAQRDIEVLNADVLDISKRHIQRLCAELGMPTTLASRDGDPAEQLIIKTNENYGGELEQRLSDAELHAFGLTRLLPTRRPHRQDHGYKLMRRRDVAPDIWNNAGLQVETYIENADDVFYRGYFLGAAFALSEGREHTIVKTIGRSERLRTCFFELDSSGIHESDVPADLRPAARSMARFCDALKLDFGCVDLVRDDRNSFYIIDATSTPHWGAEKEWSIVEWLRRGTRAG